MYVHLKKFTDSLTNLSLNLALNTAALMTGAESNRGAKGELFHAVVEDRAKQEELSGKESLCFNSVFQRGSKQDVSV